MEETDTAICLKKKQKTKTKTKTKTKKQRLKEYQKNCREAKKSQSNN